jgi:hypothetical protein
VVQHFHGVVLQDADVLDAVLADALEQRAHAGLVHLAAQEVVARARARDVGRGLAHAEADLQHQRRAAAERCGGVQQGGRVVEHEARAQLLQRLGLAAGGAAGAAHIALDAFWVGDICRRFAGGGNGGLCGFGRECCDHGARL